MIMKTIFFILLFALSGMAFASSDITLLETNAGNSDIPLTQISTLVNNVENVNLYRNVKLQVMKYGNGTPHYVLVYLFSKKINTFSITRIDVTTDYQAIKVTPHYQLQAQDIAAQPGENNPPVCPDTTTQLLVIGPNNRHSELEGALTVASAGKLAKLHTVKLLRGNATSQSILNYMSCPKLIGVYYVGDCNNSMISASDGVITSEIFSKQLLNQWGHKVTATFSCAFAFQDPLKNTIVNDLQAQKYMASTTPLYNGPADKTASCALTAIIENPARPISIAFNGCYQAYGKPQDNWDIAGDGSDFFGK